MAAIRSDSRKQSPSIRIHPPTTKPIAAEEKTKEAEQILRRLQSGSMPSLGPRVDGGRRGSCIQLGMNRENQDTKTIRTKVKSTENLNPKSLIGADLLKNLKKIQTENQNRINLDPRRCQTAEVFTRTSPFVNTSHVRSMSAVVKPVPDSSFRDLNSANRDNTSPRQGRLSEPPRNGDRVLLQRRRVSLPSGNINSRSGQADAILQKYNFPNQYDNVVDGNKNNSKNRLKVAAEVVQATLPSIKRVRSAGSIINQSIKTPEQEEHYKEKKTRSNLDASIPSRRSSVVNVSGSMGTSSCGSDDIDEETNPTRNSFNSNTSDSESESQPTSRSERNKKSNKNRSNRKSRKNKIDDLDSSDSGTDNESDEDEKCVQRTSKNALNTDSSRTIRKSSVVNCDDNNNNGDDDDIDESDTDCIDESSDLTNPPCIEEPLPGMPALDKVETRQHPSQPRKERSKTNNSEAELADDIEDLIDAIDDLIEADDEDITYEASQARKTKSFKKTVNLVMATKRIGKK